MPTPRDPAPSFDDLAPASRKASRAARGSSRKRDTKAEVRLRRALWRTGCRFRLHIPGLPGRPDIVFPKARVVVFCDGDFWHGKDWEERREKLAAGHNADYWIAKIDSNRRRDYRQTRALVEQGWTVLRVWESTILRDLDSAVREVLAVLDERGHRRRVLDPQASGCENSANGA